MRRDVFQAIADPTRRAILTLLALQAMTPNAIAEHFETRRQTVSKHLQILVECELLQQDQKGREIYSFKYCPTTLNINTTVQTQNQKQQASSLLTSSSNIDQTDYTLYDLKVQYQAGNAIDLQPGFFVASLKNHPNSVPNPMTFFTAQIGGCN